MRISIFGGGLHGAGKEHGMISARYVTICAALGVFCCLGVHAQDDPSAKAKPDDTPAKAKADGKAKDKDKDAPDEKAAPSKEAAKSPPAAEPEPKATAEQFPDLRKQWEALDGQLNDLAKQFREAPTNEEKTVIRGRYVKLVEQSEKLLPQLRSATEAAFAAEPGMNKEITDYMIKFVAYETRRQEFAAAYKLSQTLFDAKVEDPVLYALAGGAAIEMGEYDAGQKWLSIAREAKKLDAATDARLTQRLKDWENEQAIRQKEAEADDLPRVKLETTKGTIVVELFENEAPQTVGNFISLVESKAYDDKSFHRVLPGFMAQGGDPKGDGTGGPGYEIYCECYRDDYRKHFKGSLSMAHSGRDTGGSQFFITYRPTTHLDGRHTVFGRVIEGLDVVEKLQPRNPEDAQLGKTLPEPDRIVKAEVLRKREHEYAPTKVEKKPLPAVGNAKTKAKGSEK